LFTPAIEEDILSRIVEGESLRKIASTKGYPSPASIIRHAHACEEFGKRYAAARESAMELKADEILEIADAEDEDVQRSRLRVDTRKWLMSKIIPQRYGDKVQHTGQDGGPIEISWKKPEEG